MIRKVLAFAILIGMLLVFVQVTQGLARVNDRLAEQSARDVRHDDFQHNSTRDGGRP